MSQFPRTSVDGLSLSRMIVGTNWFLGWSHTSAARDALIQETVDRGRMADIIAVFLDAGVDTLMGVRPDRPILSDAIRDAEDRTGRACIRIATPTLSPDDTPAARAQNARVLDDNLAIGARICMPHQQTTDAMVDRRTRSLPGMERLCAMIRERGMIPGLSTHMPEAAVYADESGLDVGTYIQLYNAAGFLMQIEVDWVQRMIWQRRRPVMTIKPLAAGHLHPLVGLAFAWATLRPIDMVTIGTLTADEAAEVIELSLSLLEHRQPETALQTTRSKRSVMSP